MKATAWALAALLVISSAAGAEITVENYQTLRKQNSDMLEIYVGAVGIGYRWANARLKT